MNDNNAVGHVCING